MTVLVATDLDRTVVHSARAAGPVEPGAALCLERHAGLPTAMLTRRTAAALAELDRRAVWVPASTRSAAEYARLDLGRRLGVAPRYVVAACGGVLLVDGVPDPAWAARIAGVLADAAPRAEVADVLARHLARLPDGSAGRVRDADGVLLVVRVAAPAGWLGELAAACDARGWRVAVHGPKVHVLPRGLGKGAAVGEVRRRVGADRLLAAGDSPLDADLLRAADAGIQPGDGRLHESGWRADHVAVTAGTGLRAGEEIVDWLLARCP